MPSQGLILGVVSLNILIAYLEVDDRKEGKFATFSKLLSFQNHRGLPPPPPCSKTNRALQIYKYNEVT